MKTATTLDVKSGGVFEKSTDVVDFMVKKVAGDKE